MTVNTILLRRKLKVLIPTTKPNNNKKPNREYIATMVKNIQSLGFTFSAEIIQDMEKMSEEQLTPFYYSIINSLREMVGDHVSYRPMYPNFPTQVMQADESELYLNAIIHYLTAGLVLPDYEVEERPVLRGIKNLKVIHKAGNSELSDIMRNLITTNTSLSQTDKEDLEWFASVNPNTFVFILPEIIPYKENVAFISKLVLTYTKGEEKINSYFKTATDVLRLAVALSNGDISLAEDTKFVSFTKKHRRMILSLLEGMNYIEEDMIRYKEQWKRLSEKLHAGDYKNKFPKASKAIFKLHDGVKIETFGGKLQASMSNGDFQNVLNMLETRPGEFARMLDNLIRKSDDSGRVVSSFKKVVSEVSVPVLLQVKEHFQHRSLQNAYRSFFPKGNTAKVFVRENTLPMIDDILCSRIVSICEEALISKFESKENLGKVYIDSRLRNYLVPFSQRSSSKAFRTLVRGSRIPVDITDTLRTFVYWKGEDIDLSAVMYNEDWKYVDHVSYTNLRNGLGAHSGDITYAPTGASEFIDIDMNKVKDCGARYVLFAVYVYSGPTFAEHDECFMGWMNRKEPKSGEIYEPTTVINKADITSSTRQAIPLILDAVDKKIYWADLAADAGRANVNNVENSYDKIAEMGRAIVSLIKPNLYDLFFLHATARADALVDDPTEADTVFSVEKGITPYDLDIIMSQYL